MTLPKRLTETVPSRLALVLLAFSISLLTLLVAWRDIPHFIEDSYYYKDLAEGRIASVHKPFTNRVLHPLLVRGLTRIAPFRTDQSFFALGLITLFCLTLSSVWILKSTTPYPRVAGAMLFTPLLVDSFVNYYLPDLFHAALVGWFFFLTLRDKHWQSLLVLFLLSLTRESTHVLTLCFVGISLYRSRRKQAVAAIGVAALGVAVTSYAGRQGLPNVHGMNDLLYLLLKIPFNFSKNVLGVTLWTNTLNFYDPVVQLRLPGWLPLGSMHSVGVSAFDPMLPLGTMNILLTRFGLALTLVGFHFVKDYRRMLRESPFWLVLAVTYGLLSCGLGTSVGSLVDRLVGYGWPAFWLAAPVLLLSYVRVERGAVLPLLYGHIFLCWLPRFLGILPVGEFVSTLLIAPIALALHYVALERMRRLAVRLVVPPPGGGCEGRPVDAPRSSGTRDL